MRVWSLGQQVPWREAWRPTSVSLPGESYGQELGRLQSVVSERVGNDWSDLVQLSCSVVSDSLQTHGLQHARLPCPLPVPGACSNSCPLNRWCHPIISSSVTPLSSYHQFFLSIRVFSNELALFIRWPKHWSFSFNINPSKEYSGLISFRTDWFDLLTVQGTLKSLPQHYSSKASILWCSSLWSNSHIHT